jgi:hypothetical protein
MKHVAQLRINSYARILSYWKLNIFRRSQVWQLKVNVCVIWGCDNNSVLTRATITLFPTCSINNYYQNVRRYLKDLDEIWFYVCKLKLLYKCNIGCYASILYGSHIELYQFCKKGSTEKQLVRDVKHRCHQDLQPLFDTLFDRMTNKM